MAGQKIHKQWANRRLLRQAAARAVRAEPCGWDQPMLIAGRTYEFRITLSAIPSHATEKQP